MPYKSLPELRRGASDIIDDYKKGKMSSEKAVDSLVKSGGDALNKFFNASTAYDMYQHALKTDPTDEQKNIIHKKLKELEKVSANFGGRSLRTFFLIFSLVSFVLALFFSVSSLTGYSISGLAEESFRFGGIILFALGLVFAFLYFKGKKFKGKK